MTRITPPLILVTLLIGVAGYALNAIPLQPPHAGPAEFYHDCRLELQGMTGQTQGPQAWSVFMNGPSNKQPFIVIDEDKDVNIPGQSVSCKLDIRKVPQRPYDGIDWRMGRIFGDFKPFQGRPVRITVPLKADKPITFDAASFYLYDGKQAKEVAIKKLDTDWQEFVVEGWISPDATSFEVWLRTSIHGGISTTGTVHLGTVRVEVLSDNEAPPRQQAKPNPVPPAPQPKLACPVILNRSLLDATWSTNISDPNGNAPKIEARAQDGTPLGHPGALCVFKIVQLQGHNPTGTDWRVGVNIPKAALSDKEAAKIAMMLRADDDITFDTGSVYVYDGTTVVATPMTHLGTEWKQFKVNHTFGADADRLEVWLRLTLHGHISRKTNIYLGETSVDLQ
ncbi:hypothetical protein [Magnetovibrio sp.]|uniref:hypothetical protein n=1 Tax=Magnetovibrio sp. TaxID=2024836 RepID=UPI002F954D7C